MSVSLERGDVYVDLTSTEDNPLHRTKLSLYELVQCQPSAKEPDGVPEQASMHGLKQQLANAALQLTRHGREVLSGDFSLRNELLNRRAEEWLRRKWHDIMQARLYSPIEDGFNQVTWEYRRFNREQSEAVWRAIDRWMQSAEEDKRAFANHLLAIL